LSPPRPEPRDQRLPPILRSSQPASVPDCSKGPRGLSVLLRVDGIFTATSISPSLRSRQRPSRYAVHARRNLPDKELRSVMLPQRTQRAQRRPLRACVLWGLIFLSASACRHAARTISFPIPIGIWRVVSEDSSEKSETRNPNDESNPNDECSNGQREFVSSFGHSNLIRHSSFGFRVYPAGLSC
jgi:hypothetical protein